MGTKRGPQIALADFGKVQALATERGISLDAAAAAFVAERVTTSPSVDREALEKEYQSLLNAESEKNGANGAMAKYIAYVSKGKQMFDNVVALQTAAKTAVLSAKPLPQEIATKTAIHASHYESRKGAPETPFVIDLSIEIAKRKQVKHAEGFKRANGYTPRDVCGDSKYAKEFAALVAKRNETGKPLTQAEIGAALFPLGYKTREGKERPHWNYTNEKCLIACLVPVIAATDKPTVETQVAFAQAELPAQAL